MSSLSDFELRPLWPVLGIGGLLGVVLILETFLITAGFVQLPDGYVVGVATSIPFLVGLLYGWYWIEQSDLSPGRYARINRWCLGGVAVFLFINFGLILALPPESLLGVVGWVRWAASLGGGIGLLIGLFEARAIDRERAAVRTRTRKEEIKRERDRLEEFAGIVSHDLRNPLSVASGHLDLARQRHADDAHLEAVESSLKRMDDIIEETLVLARQGKKVDQTTPVDLEEFVSQCWATVDTEGAELAVHDTTTIRADRNRLQHVFENLFRNCVEHGSTSNRTQSDDNVEHGSTSPDSQARQDSVEHAGTDVTIRVGIIDEPGTNGFYIDDDGPGIPEEKREQVLETGYTTSEDGSGFGLAIVAGIVEAHGWEITITDADDGGARFEITGIEFVD